MKYCINIDITYNIYRFLTLTNIACCMKFYSEINTHVLFLELINISRILSFNNAQQNI